MEREKRAHVRVPARLKVFYAQDGARVEARSRDLSLGGMFIECARPLPFGAEHDFELHLPALAQPVTVRATVRWVKSDGMGVSFGALRAAETWAMNAMIAEYAR